MNRADDEKQRQIGDHAIGNGEDDEEDRSGDQQPPPADVVGDASHQRCRKRAGVGVDGEKPSRLCLRSAELQNAEWDGREKLKRGEKGEEGINPESSEERSEERIDSR